MALGSTQPLTEMSTRNIIGGKGRPALRADLTAIYEPIVQKMWGPRPLTTLWASTASYRDTFTYFTYFYHLNPIQTLTHLLLVIFPIEAYAYKVIHSISVFKLIFCIHISSSLCVLRVCPSHPPRFDHHHNI
jgi:hypothetical protein